jgi:FKBP-type peptidyl-prolyl cis-trans isomerase
VHYTGRLDDGTVFDSSYDRQEPIEFELGARAVIRGWDEGIAGMRVGGRRQLVIPAHLGYGAQGAPPTIPRNALLHFDVELVSIQSGGGWFDRIVSLAKALPLK